MNTLNQLLVAATAVVTLNLTVHAAEPALSPKAAMLRQELRKVPGTSSVDLTSNGPTGNAKAWALAQDFRKVSSTGPQIDLAHAARPTFAPKDPRYEAALRENALAQRLPGKAIAAK